MVRVALLRPQQVLDGLQVTEEQKLDVAIIRRLKAKEAMQKIVANCYDAPARRGNLSETEGFLFGFRGVDRANGGGGGRIAEALRRRW